MCIHSMLCHSAHLRQYLGKKCKKPKNVFLSMISMGLDKAVCAPHNSMSQALQVMICMIWPCQPKAVPVTGMLLPLCIAFCYPLICYPLL